MEEIMLSKRKVLKELKNIGRKISQTGLVIGEGGNISARIGNIVYIKAKGASMGDAKPSSYIPLDIKTEIGRASCRERV